MTIGSFILDPDDVMAPAVQRRHHALVSFARECYALRNRAGDSDRATFYQETGDRFFARSRALLAEWETTV